MTGLFCRVSWGLFGALIAVSPLQASQTRPLTMVVPFPATGTPDIEGTPRLTKMVKLAQSLSTPTLTDLLAQGLAAGLGVALDRTVQIERKSGNRGNDGMRFVANSARDAQVLLFADSRVAGEREVSGRDSVGVSLALESIGRVADMPMALVIEERARTLSLRDVIAQTQIRPGRTTIATLAPFSSSAFAAVALQRAAAINLLPVEYNGAADALNALATRNVEIALVPLPAALPHVGGGKLKIVAVTSAMRHPAIPATPTVAESAIKGFAAGGGFALFAAKGTPSKTMALLRLAADSVIVDEGWTRLLLARGLLPPMRYALRGK